MTHNELAQRDEIPALLWNSDCMILPTAGGNYGHVIAEALQAGCPVITTPTTPWTQVIREGGGNLMTIARIPATLAALLDRWAGKTWMSSRLREEAPGGFRTVLNRSWAQHRRTALAALSDQAARPPDAHVRG